MSTSILIVLGLSALLILSFPLLNRKLAENSGWKALAEAYGTDQKRIAVKGTSINLYTAIIGGLNYTNILRSKVTKNGLYISTIWPFKMSHSAIIIPWKEFKGVESIKSLNATKRLKIGIPTITTIDLNEKNFKLLKKHLRERSRLNV